MNSQSQTPAHSKVNGNGPTVLEIDEKILRSPSQLADGVAHHHAAQQFAIYRLPELVVRDLDARNGFADDERFEAPPEHLHLGKLGHKTILPPGLTALGYSAELEERVICWEGSGMCMSGRL